MQENQAPGNETKKPALLAQGQAFGKIPPAGHISYFFHAASVRAHLPGMVAPKPGLLRQRPAMQPSSDSYFFDRGGSNPTRG